jgi:hypothetical protein
MDHKAFDIDNYFANNPATEYSNPASSGKIAGSNPMVFNSSE